MSDLTEIVKNEDEQMKNDTWNLSALFKSDDDSEMEKKRKIVLEKSYAFINKWKDRTDYLENPEVLKQALDEYEEWSRNYGSSGDEGYYFHLRSAQDQNNTKLKAKVNKLIEFSVKIDNDIQFFTLRIARIPQNLQNQFLNYKGLSPYKHFLEKSFEESKHLLSEPEEKIINLKSTPAYRNWVKMTSGFLSKEEREVILEDGKKAVKPFSEIYDLIDNKNKKVRDGAAEAFNDILKRHLESAEAEINSILLNKKIDDELRKAERPDTLRHLSDDVDSQIVDTMVAQVSKNFDLAKRFYVLKAKIFNVKKLEYHERNLEYGESKNYSYKEAIQLVNKVFLDLDKEFSEILLRFVENGQMDVFPRKNKADGAFCAHELLSQPTYILLNHSGKLKDVLTIAHECGHGINNELMRKKQNALNFGTPLSTAEVASTFMEDFVLRELVKESNDEQKLEIMMTKLNSDIATIFRQVACYKFERELHKNFREKGYLSKEEIGSLFQKNMSAYMGDSVEQSSGSENWWVYWSHIRRFFYNYSYASGLLISKALQSSVRENPEFIHEVKEFLATGLSDSPKNIFHKLRIDITDKKFWNKGIKEVEDLLDESEKLAKKLEKV